MFGISRKLVSDYIDDVCLSLTSGDLEALKRHEKLKGSEKLNNALNEFLMQKQKEDSDKLQKISSLEEDLENTNNAKDKTIDQLKIMCNSSTEGL